MGTAPVMEFCFTVGKKRFVFNWGVAQICLLTVIGESRQKEVAQLTKVDYTRSAVRSSETLAKAVRRILEFIEANAETLRYSYGFVNPLSGKRCFGKSAGGLQIGRHFYSLETGYGRCRLVRYKATKGKPLKLLEAIDVRNESILKFKFGGSSIIQELELLRKKGNPRLESDLKRLLAALNTRKREPVLISVE
jgi:hypothetical protein